MRSLNVMMVFSRYKLPQWFAQLALLYLQEVFFFAAAASVRFPTAGREEGARQDVRTSLRSWQGQLVLENCPDQSGSVNVSLTWLGVDNSPFF